MLQTIVLLRNTDISHILLNWSDGGLDFYVRETPFKNYFIKNDKFSRSNEYPIKWEFFKSIEIIDLVIAGNYVGIFSRVELK